MITLENIVQMIPSLVISVKANFQRFNMKRHLSEFHRDGTEVFRCEECNTYFSNQRNLNRHLQTRHKEEEHFKCNLCEKLNQKGYIKETLKN